MAPPPGLGPILRLGLGLSLSLSLSLGLGLGLGLGPILSSEAAEQNQPRYPHVSMYPYIHPCILYPCILYPLSHLTPLSPQESPELPMPPLMAGPKLLHDPYGDKPAAHVVASSSSPSLQWAADVAPAQMRNGFRLHGNRLVVPRDGLYFVYAAAAFQGGGGCSSPPPPLLRLAVSRYSQEYPKDVTLLTAVRSVRRECRGGGAALPWRRGDALSWGRCHGDGHRCCHGDGLWFESLYQGAVFQLRRGDQLAATTTAGRFLDLHGGGGAYFGVVGMD
ncbi:LOW QUALITY PROTEIN: tumor necrosis factor [Melopsittacus undulatus]|uniref:LOW QUALITY PROTEIN: tumor necrosis factor n=1 Tax=Melopsittacus undulatus TaxID=13146 RepID=UPI00146AEC78|nr:LOW QUALITY PROTEIN: tumor necrosis factor [Melopsittacus undulatus]